VLPWSHWRSCSWRGFCAFCFWEVGAFPCFHHLKCLTPTCSSNLCKQKRSPWQWNNPSLDEPTKCTSSTLWFGLGWICSHTYHPLPCKPPLSPSLPFGTAEVDLDFLLVATTLAGLVCLVSCVAWPWVELLHLENQLPSCPKPPW